MKKKCDSDIVGVYTCQGEVNPKVLEKVKEKAVPPVWIGDAVHAQKNPDQADLSALKQMILKL